LPQRESPTSTTLHSTSSSSSAASIFGKVQPSEYWAVCPPSASIRGMCCLLVGPTNTSSEPVLPSATANCRYSLYHLSKEFRWQGGNFHPGQYNGNHRHMCVCQMRSTFLHIIRAAEHYNLTNFPLYWYPIFLDNKVIRQNLVFLVVLNSVSEIHLELVNS
jgi:hypothetical protein